MKCFPAPVRALRADDSSPLSGYLHCSVAASRIFSNFRHSSMCFVDLCPQNCHYWYFVSFNMRQAFPTRLLLSNHCRKTNNSPSVYKALPSNLLWVIVHFIPCKNSNYGNVPDTLLFLVLGDFGDTSKRQNSEA